MTTIPTTAAALQPATIAETEQCGSLTLYQR